MNQEELTDDYFATGLPMYRAFLEQEKFEGHPSEDTSRRFPRDQRLRKAGCKIEHRPKGMEAVWSHPKHGKRPQSAMCELLAAEAAVLDVD